MNATESLREDHRVIERMLTVLEAAATRLRAGEPVPARLFRDAVDFVRSFADKWHHGKEETNLFPRMEERGVPREDGPLAVMMHEHVMGRDYIAAIDGEIGAYEQGDAAAGRVIEENVRGYVGLLRDHVWKEENVLFPMADQVLSEDDQRELEQRFKQVEEDVMGPEVRERYDELLDRAERDVGIASS